MAKGATLIPVDKSKKLNSAKRIFTYMFVSLNKLSGVDMIGVAHYKLPA
ncbi:hypothetical protein YPPY34_1391 [Yersinia pestis PY-34]|nr:hypothetical protein YPC_3039 [Yersinia pestis biovar Medievalis str. Harbin 35]EEO75268.1 hypothetical protein YP516_3165 [Yersinia pestis Nepal516]EEO81629.1 hypothetical protein YPF_1594 [Yersinia pestis biovar Orientalis str. India 195]EEO87530.1 hypothetical protein YPH_3489 [Yersinia pestis biovar Orientalis str. PEXU2]EEO91059.1 hypothetical protein YPS_1931 [Yersinia pestis Pestoides A]EIR06482.1 hypothetical protein YPPY05_1377 [Yersinia pestis PY-05]EIR36516.1 hypothetical protei